MFQLVYTKRFQKDIKLLQKRGYNLDVLKQAVETLEMEGNLPIINKPHRLSGDYANFMEAHLKPDWLLIWKYFPEDNEIWLTRTGTHSDLF
jgi:mRNA interferase YafQ